ncbi:F-box protein At3g07870-like [Rhododendron vialii]|uniref:F-box protein At3g07870-like n=1 Tax=Rhododendron vialii TaxID=182163 RepID=UPI00265DE52D|nr:F-box protein At3g07870-like [Rhododendron vialii]
MRRSKRLAHRAAAAVPAVTISDLPSHITCDILSRLPLNSIFTCKRVCKTWRELTLEPYFAKLHHSRSPLSLFSYQNGININNKTPSSHFEILPLHDPWVIPRPMKFRLDIYFPHMYIVASCNGSILLSNFSSNDDLDTVIVFNPLRAQHFMLPKPPKLARQTDKLVRLGLGHSPSNDQYKVLRLTSTYRPGRLYCDIFTIGIDDEWRSMGDTGQPPTHRVARIIFLNGALHWIGVENLGFICYFDVEKEQFGSVPLPSHIGEGFTYLRVVDNQLYLHNDHSCSVWRFWAMKDYGDFGSWTLEWVIEEPIIYKYIKGHVRPLRMLKDGSLLMMFKSSPTQDTKTTLALASYNPRTRVLKKNKKRVIVPWSTSVADTDIPCFFSPMDALK